jgi:mycothiol synthase
LHDAAEEVDGHPSLAEAVWRDLDRPLEPVSAGVFASTDGRGDPAGFAYVYRSDSFSPPHWAVGLLVDPATRDAEVVEALLRAATDHVAAHGGGDVVLWVLDPGAEVERGVGAAGFVHQRDLHQQRVALPVAEAPRWPEGVEVRPFVPGRDDEDWLRVNNRAFASHPEQGGWNRATLDRRLAEAWFDPDGFLLAFDDRGLAGFCWTKVHPAADPDPVLGEIFVIGVDPDHQGTGLGRALVLGGLASLADRGIGTGMLFVDGSNEPAMRLYDAIGFRTHRIDRAYGREVPGP